jgi:ELP3 family radical SAM enzyme/protein acetyltransferase
MCESENSRTTPKGPQASCLRARGAPRCDIEELDKHLDNVLARTYDQPTKEDALKMYDFFKEVFNGGNLHQLKRKHNNYAKNSFIMKAFGFIKEDFPDVSEKQVRDTFRIKHGKSHSGIISITVFTSGDKFSCKWDCSYCPNEPGQPRSYLKGEPGVLRANKNGFDCVRQMHDRMETLYANGHDIDKLEVLVLGGTWTSYPLDYRETFIRDIYYAANTFMQYPLRAKKSMWEEKDMNRKSSVKVIGLTLETRPDTICDNELRLLRSYGCTRVQIGIQHTDDDILRMLNRGCSFEDAVRAIRMLKDAGFKIDAHWMPNLPGSTVKKDEEMLCNQLLGIKSKVYKSLRYKVYEMVSEELQVDQWKVYPCTIVPYTKIEQWYIEGSYIPYPWEDLTDMLIKMKSLMLPWIRLNRIVRDIPTQYSLLEEYRSNLRNDLHTILESDGGRCRCIRCREIKNDPYDPKDAVFDIMEYNASGGTEYFISFVHPADDRLYGFCRLRLTKNQLVKVFPQLKGCGLIRELHVYGLMTKTSKKGEGEASQHHGLGKRLLGKAYEIAKKNGFEKVSVIPGEGVKDYYAKQGFREVGDYMMRTL